ncbi:MAG: polysaccharide export protein [Bryobacterales bacterium]|nr:polysaccharide export protein [Bryobacterales bacterium]
MRLRIHPLVLSGLLAAVSFAQKPVAPPTTTVPVDAPRAADSSPLKDYILGPEDMLSVRVLNAEEVANTPYAIDLLGNLTLPRIGKIHAAGLTLGQLEAELTTRFGEYLQHPLVTVAVSEFHSQPISVLGEVDTPGVHQMKGRKTLFEVISEAGGLKDDAGNSIKITRRKEWGPIPLPNATMDPSGEYSVAEVDIHSVMTAQNPRENISVKPNDVITVPKADLVYVIGAVTKPGGFVLSEKANISILQALSMAEGLQRTAGSGNGKILRTASGSSQRVEIPVNVKNILAGKQPDVPLLANDILFIPSSAAKSASLRALEAIIQTGTGVAIYAHPF